jgi:hypothetical protein
MTMTGTTPTAEHFITATLSIAEEVTAVAATAAEGLTVQVQQAGLLTETARPLADTRNLTARAASAPAPSAATTMADKREAFQHAEIRASAGGAGFTVVVVVVADLTAAAITNRSSTKFHKAPDAW